MFPSVPQLCCMCRQRYAKNDPVSVASNYSPAKIHSFVDLKWRVWEGDRASSKKGKGSQNWEGDTISD